MPPPLTPFSPCAPLFCFSGLRSGIGAARGTPLFLTSGGRLHAQGGGGTYNVHDGQHILFHISAPMVGYHHLVSYHQGLHVALSTDRALQTWLASLCFIAQGPGRWWLQAAQPPWPPLPWFLIWMENFWSFQVLDSMACLSVCWSICPTGCQTPCSFATGCLVVQCLGLELPHYSEVWFYKDVASPLPNRLVEQLPNTTQHSG